MKKFLLSLMSLLALPAMAQTFEYEGIIYQVYDSGFLTCITADGEDTMNYISGDVTIPSTVMFNDEEYTVIGIGQYSFLYADEFYKQPWTLTLPNTIGFIGYGSFWHCEYLTHVQFSENLFSIGDSAFSHCYNLGNVNLPAALTTVDNWAFYANHSMTEIILPPNLTSTGKYAFCGPRDSDAFTGGIGGIVEKIYIPAGFDELNQRVFGYQPNLKAVYCYADTPPVLTSAPFNHSTTEESDLFVPANSVESYKNDEKWMNWQWVSVNAITEEYPWVWEANNNEPDEPDTPENPDAGVESIMGDNVPAKYFDLNGRSVNSENLIPGIYIVKQGKDTRKIMVH